jgi:hypothetical protein
MGPAFTILVRDPLSKIQISELDAWLRTFTTMHQVHTNAAGELDAWQFWVSDARELGLEYGLKSCLIGLSLIDPTREWDWGIEEQIMLRLGFWPRHSITIWAGCKDFSTGRVMSYLTLQLMQRYSGYLDLCIHQKVLKSQSPYVEDDDHAPGKCFTIHYWISDPCQTVGGSGWYSKEISDVERVRWLLKDEQNVLYGFRGP